MPGKSDYFVIDLDYEFSNSIEARYAQVVSILGPPIPITSSASRGVHLYYFLREDAWRPEISKAVKKVLTNAGVILRPGYCELFPGTIDHLRLPLGRGSVVLNVTTMAPLGLNLADSIKYFISNRQLATINPFNGKASFTVSAPSAIHEPPTRYSSLRQPAVNGINGDLDPSGLPIPDYGTRNDSMLKFIQHCMLKCKFDEAETLTRTIDWLSNQTLGHKSFDLERNPSQVLRQAAAAVHAFARRLGDGSEGLARAPLSVRDVEAIVEMTSALRRLGRYGRRAYYTQQFVFHLLSVFKAKDTKPLFIPFNAAARFDGASNDTAAERLQFCIGKEVIQIVTDFDRRKHQCRQYRLKYAFTEGKEVTRLDEGLLEIYGYSDLLKNYSRGIYDRITRC